MLNLQPFLLFDGNCREAMTFYQSCFGGELILTKLGDTPMKDRLTHVSPDKIIYGHLKSGPIEFSATDWSNHLVAYHPGNNYGLYLNDGTLEELKGYFDKLVVGANQEKTIPLQQMPFGLYGSLVDKFGIYWIFRGDK